MLRLIVANLILSGFLSAQPTYFQRIYGNENSNLYFTEIIKCENSNYIITGYTNLEDPLRDGLYLLKINSFGLPIWSKVISSPSISVIPYKIIEKNNKFIILGATDSLFSLTLDSAGNQLSRKTYSLFEFYFNYLNNDVGNGFIASGTTGGNQSIIVNFDSELNIVNTKIFTAGFSIKFEKIIPFAKNYYVLGYSKDSIQERVYPKLYKLNSNFDTLFSKKILINGNNLQPNDFFISNNQFVIFSTKTLQSGEKRNFIIKTDFNFNIVDTLTIVTQNHTAYSDELKKVIKLNNGNYVTQSRYLAQNSDYFYKLLDSNFNVRKTKFLNIGFTNDISLENLYSSNDTSILSIGSYRYNGDLTANHFGYINKMDTALNINQGILSISKSQIIQSKDITIGPNPFNSQVKIFFEKFDNSIKKIEIFNILGQVVYENHNIFIFQNNLLINMNTYFSGVYFLKITLKSNDSVFKKIILIK